MGQKNSKSLFFILLVGVLLFSLVLFGCTEKKDPEKKKELENILNEGLFDGTDEPVLFEDEDLNPKYSPQIIKNSETGETQISLIIDNESFLYPYDERYKDAMLWMEEKLPKKSTILTWWPHAGMIMGYTNMYVIAFAPSPKSFDIKEVTKQTWNSDYLSTDEDLENIAQSFLSIDSYNSFLIMGDYTSEFVVIFKDDEKYLDDLYKHIGRSVSEHFDGDKLSLSGRLTIFNRMIKDTSVGNFNQIYRDDFVNIYARTHRMGG